MDFSLMISMLSKGNTGDEILRILDAIVGDEDQDWFLLALKASF